MIKTFSNNNLIFVVTSKVYLSLVWWRDIPHKQFEFSCPLPPQTKRARALNYKVYRTKNTNLRVQVQALLPKHKRIYELHQASTKTKRCVVF